MSKPSSTLTVTAQVFLGTMIPCAVASNVVFVKQISKFPISQRRPEIVLAVVSMITFAQFLHILSVGFPTSVFGLCGAKPVRQLLINCGVVLTIYRSFWLLSKDFLTKNLIRAQSIRGISTAQIQELNLPCHDRLVHKFVAFCLSKMSTNAFILSVTAPASFVSLLIFVWYFVIQIPNLPSWDPQCTLQYETSQTPIIFLGVFCFLLGAVFGVPLTRVKDNFRIGTEIGSLTILAFLIILITPIMVATSKQYHELVEFIAIPIIFCSGFVIIETWFPLYLAWKNEKVQEKKIVGDLMKPEVNTTRSTNSSTKQAELLLSIINTPGSRKIFLKFLESEFSVENLFFFESCESFKQKGISGEKREELFSQAKYIVDIFINTSSASSVNISHKTRSKVLGDFSTVSAEASDPSIGIFEKAKDEIFNLMVQDSFNRFKGTKEFMEHVNSEIKSVEIA
jgi:hypothetical protein